MAQVGRLPIRGELVAGPSGYEIEVLDADPRRIRRVRILRSSNRPVERDREGRRRFKTSETTSPVIAPASAADTPAAEAAKEPAKSPPAGDRPKTSGQL
jgi:hypothetical protein